MDINKDIPVEIVECPSSAAELVDALVRLEPEGLLGTIRTDGRYTEGQRRVATSKRRNALRPATAAPK